MRVLYRGDTNPLRLFSRLEILISPTKEKNRFFTRLFDHCTTSCEWSLAKSNMAGIESACTPRTIRAVNLKIASTTPGGRPDGRADDVLFPLGIAHPA